MLTDVEIIYGKDFVSKVCETMFPGKTIVDLKTFLKKLPKYLELREYLVLGLGDDTGCIPGKYVSKPGLYFYIPETDKWCLLCENKADIYERKLFVLQDNANKQSPEDSEKVSIICKKCPRLSYIYGTEFLQKITPFITKDADLISLQCIISAISDYLNSPGCKHSTRYLGKVPSFILKDTTDKSDCVQGVCKDEFYVTGLYVKLENRWTYVVESVPEIRLYHDFLIGK